MYVCRILVCFTCGESEVYAQSVLNWLLSAATEYQVGDSAGPSGSAQSMTTITATIDFSLISASLPPPQRLPNHNGALAATRNGAFPGRQKETLPAGTECFVQRYAFYICSWHEALQQMLRFLPSPYHGAICAYSAHRVASFSLARYPINYSHPIFVP